MNWFVFTTGTQANDALYFVFASTDNGSETWVSDGTP